MIFFLTPVAQTPPLGGYPGVLRAQTDRSTWRGSWPARLDTRDAEETFMGTRRRLAHKLILGVAATLMVSATLTTADSQELIFSPKYIGR
jgi:hypothetical protein